MTKLWFNPPDDFSFGVAEIVAEDLKSKGLDPSNWPSWVLEELGNALKAIQMFPALVARYSELQKINHELGFGMLNKISRAQRELTEVVAVAKLAQEQLGACEINRLKAENEKLRTALLKELYNNTDAEIYGEDYARLQAQKELEEMLRA